MIVHILLSTRFNTALDDDFQEMFLTRADCDKHPLKDSENSNDSWKVLTTSFMSGIGKALEHVCF